MFALGICIGVSLGMGILTICHSPFFVEMKRAEAEMAHEMLSRAREEHHAAALHVIAANDESTCAGPSRVQVTGLLLNSKIEETPGILTSPSCLWPTWAGNIRN